MQKNFIFSAAAFFLLSANRFFHIKLVDNFLYEKYRQVVNFQTVNHCRYEGYDMSIATNDQEEVTVVGTFHHFI